MTNKEIKCLGCGNPIHPKRLEILPNTKSCVECSTTGKKAGITMTYGEGDHTYNDIIIVEPEDFIKYKKLQPGENREDEIDHPESDSEIK